MHEDQKVYCIHLHVYKSALHEHLLLCICHVSDWSLKVICTAVDMGLAVNIVSFVFKFLLLLLALFVVLPIIVLMVNVFIRCSVLLPSLHEVLPKSSSCSSAMRDTSRVNSISNEPLRMSTMNVTIPNWSSVYQNAANTCPSRSFIGDANVIRSTDWSVYLLCFANDTGFFLLNITDEIGKEIYYHTVTTTLFTLLGLPFILCIWNYFNGITESVRTRFENPEMHALIREGDHFPRKDEDKVRRAFLDKTDTLGLVGVVFGPAGTGKSNVVRTVCRSKTLSWFGKDKGVAGAIYMEVGSPHQFPYHLAKACGVPVEPNLFSVAISKLFPAWKTHLTLPSKDQDALALVLPVIAEGGKSYKKNHIHKHIPVLFIDGVDILAKQDEELYKNLVNWAKKCANEDSLRIVLVCSDSHVLALDQQSFKSRLDSLIEIDDVSEDQAVNILMVDKYGFTNDLATATYSIVGGRLSDIHKIVAKWRKVVAVVPQEVVNATKDIKGSDHENLQNTIDRTLNGSIKKPTEDKSNEIADSDKRKCIQDIIRSYNFIKKKSFKKCGNNVVIPQEIVEASQQADFQVNFRGILNVMKLGITNPNKDHSSEISDPAQKKIIYNLILLYYCTEKLKEQFAREMRQALCKALDKDKYKIKKYIIEQV